MDGLAAAARLSLGAPDVMNRRQRPTCDIQRRPPCDTLTFATAFACIELLLLLGSFLISKSCIWWIAYSEHTRVESLRLLARSLSTSGSGFGLHTERLAADIYIRDPLISLNKNWFTALTLD